MSTEYQIAQLWIGGRLSYLEQLCAISFRDAGHHVKLYTYEGIENAPDGVEICDAAEILPDPKSIPHKRTGSPAPQADKWRYNMLAKCDRTIWADTDAYCVKPFTSNSGRYYGWESASHINNGVVGLPKDSDALGQLIDFTKDEYAIPPWFDEKTRDEMVRRKEAGDPVHVGEQSWGVWGPQALTYFLHETGEETHAMPIEVLFPISFKKRRLMLKPNLPLGQYITDNTCSIHFWGRRMRMRLIEREGGEPHPDSLIGRLLTKHGVVPSDAPLPQGGPHKPVEKQMIPGTSIPVIDNSDRAGRGTVNLTDIADRLRLDQGTQKHRYSELYNLIFQPYRQRTSHLALLGLGSPQERDGMKSRPLAMWQEFLPKAQITGFDPEPPKETDGSKAIETEFFPREALREALADTGQFDFVLDDATHASHDQQSAFLEFFPKLKTGGVYIIEDLRFQPKASVKPGWPKTATLFQGYLHEGGFAHPEAEYQDGLNALRADFSGVFVFQAKWHKEKRDQVLVVHKR